MHIFKINHIPQPFTHYHSFKVKDMYHKNLSFILPPVVYVFMPPSISLLQHTSQIANDFVCTSVIKSSTIPSGKCC